MKSLTTRSRTHPVTGYDSYANFASHIISTDDNNSHYYSHAAPEMLKDHPGQFTAGLAHELRNPLTDINLSVGMLESAIKSDDLKVYLDIIMRSSIRISDLVTELLKYQPGNEAPVEKYSIHQLLDEVLALVEDRITLKNIVVRKDFAAQDCKVEWNKLQMKIALTNIIINAIDAMTAGKGKLKLVTKSIYGKYLIQIEDNGCGINKANIKEIFKPYFTNKPGGLGIGLAAAYEILQSNHIRVNVESEVDKGTCFNLSFDKLVPVNIQKRER